MPQFFSPRIARYLLVASTAFSAGCLVGGRTLNDPKINSQILASDTPDSKNRFKLSVFSAHSPLPEPINQVGLPEVEVIKVLPGYLCLYDRRNRIPRWTLELLTNDTLRGDSKDVVNRNDFVFMEDLEEPQEFRSTNADYAKSGFDRGHLAAAGNNLFNSEAMEKTFLLTNIAPQRKIRGISRQSANVVIVTGPLFLPSFTFSERGHRQVIYEVIGNNRVAVPTHFFKAIAVQKRIGGPWKHYSWVIPNQAIPDDIDVNRFIVPLDDVERAAGWFHHNLEGIQAEKLLLEKGDPGSFLVRPSWTNPGNFTLSVRREDCVTHIRIRNTGDFLDLYGGETFATLSELVDYYRENHGELKEKNGSIIELRYPLFCQDPLAESSRWFHGPMSRSEAQKLLVEKGKNGSFLVRESIQKPGSYVLSVATGEQVSHILINRKKDNKFDAGGGHQFSTLKELIDFYTATPMVEKNGGLVYLKQPFNATRLNVSAIAKRIRQLECENVNGKHLAGFHEEFEELHQDIHDTKARSRLEGAKSYNLDKNRYKNILPFDSTLVRLLDGDPTIPGSDYINANYISWPDALTESLLGGSTTVDPLPPKTTRGSPAPLTPSSSAPRYIATQGTLPNTIVDFWRMVWQEHSAIIVMITKEMERGRNKCSRYWPTPTQPNLELTSYGGTLRVRHLAEKNLETYTLRELYLSRDPPNVNNNDINKANNTAGGNKGFVVYHYQFHAWPDHGTPADPSCVLNFMFDISKRMESLLECGPMIVHCSAGIGRSGTFIVIDMLISYIKRYGLQCDIDISRTVQAVREQRSGMVQIETQYRFIYKAVQNFVSTLSRRLQLHNELQPLGVDYTNINQAPADLMQIQRPDSTSPVDRRLSSTSPCFSKSGSLPRKREFCDAPSYTKSIMSHPSSPSVVYANTAARH